ncbi:MAG: SDR family NAD(P)-dependent oxidoreductase, partial [Spirochaetia bacterium]
MSSSSAGQRRKALRDLVSLSREYGSNIDFVVAGGGNTSVKIGDELWVKSSGAELAEAHESTFVALDRKALTDALAASYPEDSDEREALVKRALLRSMLRPDLGGRPSVEASLHNLISYRFVVHTHPWKVNALTCSRNGPALLRERFAERAIVLPYFDPGYKLAVKLEREIRRFVGAVGHAPQIIFLGNHGVFIAADTAAGIRALTTEVVSACEQEISPLSTIRKTVARRQASGGARPTADTVAAEIVNVIRSSLSTDGRKTTALLRNDLSEQFCSSPEAFKAVALPFTPDQIVYCRSHPLYVRATTAGGLDAGPIIKSYIGALAAYRTKHGADPYVVCVQGIGLVTAGDSAREAGIIADLFHDTMKIAYATAKNGGPRPMSARARQFIESWEVEHYRRALSTGSSTAGCRTAIVTGGAQGFGEGIVRSLHAEGYNVVIADLNVERGTALAAELGSAGPTPRSASNGITFVETNVADEESVANLLVETVLAYGGCDLFISNAGILKAGGLEEIDSDSFDLVTSVNYKGYFLCAKHASVVMKRQHEYAPYLHSDIVQINSKSGLEGSNKNFTYAGGKFGGLGLTQSF